MFFSCSLGGGGRYFSVPRFGASCTTIAESQSSTAVRAEIISEVTLAGAGPVFLLDFFTGIKSFQTDSSNLSCKKRINFRGFGASRRSAASQRHTHQE